MHASGPRFLGGCQQATGWGDSHPKAPLDPQDPPPSLLTWLLADCTRSTSKSLTELLASLGGSPQLTFYRLPGCPNVAAGEERERESPRQKPQMLYKLVLEVTSHHFRHIPFTGREPLGPAHIQGEGTTAGCGRPGEPHQGGHGEKAERRKENRNFFREWKEPEPSETTQTLAVPCSPGRPAVQLLRVPASSSIK